MKQSITQKTTLGDAAVDGLLDGVAAGVLMAIYLVAVNLIGGEGVTVLGRFDPNGTSPLVGTLLHLAVSGVYGAAFGISWKYVRRLNLPAWLIGLGFGIVLFALAELVLLPTSQSSLAKISFAQLGSAHIVYGIVIGWMVGRSTQP